MRVVATKKGNGPDKRYIDASKSNRVNNKRIKTTVNLLFDKDVSSEGASQRLREELTEDDPSGVSGKSDKDKAIEAKTWLMGSGTYDG